MSLEVWTAKDLWKGFQMCCTFLLAGDDTGATCFTAALALPTPQLAALLKAQSKVRLPLKRHAEKLVKARDTSIPKDKLRLLGLDG